MVQGGRFNVNTIPKISNGALLTGSAEQGFLTLFEKHGIAPDRAYFCHNQCFRQESSYDAYRRAEFDKIEVCMIFGKVQGEGESAQLLWDQVMKVAAFSQATHDKIHAMYEESHTFTPGYFAPTTITKEKDILTADLQFVSPDGVMETHSFVLYKRPGDLIPALADTRVKLLFYTLAAFPRFLKPFGGHILEDLL